MLLSEMLKSATAQAHDRAEHSPYTTRLTAGSYDAHEVAVFLAQHHALYSAMEGILHRRYVDDPLLAQFLDQRLDRTGRLAEDLTALLGPHWRERTVSGEIPIVPATQRYVDLVEGADAEWALANHYVRYLGDLSGGQILSRLFAREYGIPTRHLSFYDFSEVGKPKPYKDAYRRRLDTIVDEPQKRRITQHAIDVFGLNEAMFHDLGSRAPSAA